MTRRLLATYVTFALLILLGLEVPLGYAQSRNEQNQAFEQLEHDAEVLAAFIDSALARNDMLQIEVLARESAQRLGGNVEVMDAHGQILASTYPPERPADSPTARSDVDAVLRGQGRVSARMSTAADVRTMSVVVSVHPGLQPHGALEVNVPATAVTTRVQHFELMLAAAGILLLAAAAGTAFALARWISRPIRALELATRTLADGPLPVTLPVDSGPPEVRRLAVTYKTTAERLNTLITSQRSFNGHASHQLKTPLAALRLRLENLEPDIAADGHNNLQAALHETDRLARMVELLLAMARAEQSALPQEDGFLTDTIDRRICFWEPLAISRGIHLATSGPVDVGVRAVPTAIEQIIDNLVSNALRVAPHGSTVTISWHVIDQADSAPEVELHVIDEGPGLTAEQRTQALVPFWRAPSAGTGGTGLGLALVRALAVASGGTAELRPSGTGGIDAVVRLPAGSGRSHQQLSAMPSN
ncbi:Sensor histidine kinase yclK [Actinoplanes sp. SE50]|uniref:sensor histidine kinase n=1 Tax=unclassified Actinoplanes TaxID=2626549 RepID=UPI00023EC923|nr:MULTISPECIES: HAMP domain-containing sensor histidine kinase [unclassified Actinoplanes]AEV83141.1 Sensor histidine kinase yclK [Actinoplanes sp. SE50/110]ATO81535.1 Sensor histidine kinase yclK [Actinoplanes sp. SE50]SLL98942.1 Sensor histidine kinase [Actinoplanes sp. SE50/110]